VLGLLSVRAIDLHWQVLAYHFHLSAFGFTFYLLGELVERLRCIERLGYIFIRVRDTRIGKACMLQLDDLVVFFWPIKQLLIGLQILAR